MSETIQIHETAFITSSYRATDKNLSQDSYAHLWSNPKTDVWIQQILEQVSKEEPLMHCLRNRYFFDQINTQFRKGKIDYLINFGAGFSMYPFMVDEGIQHIEIDKSAVIDYKSNKIKQWTAEGLLPKKKIQYIAADFITDDFSTVLNTIKGITGESRSFILLEGVLFFLSPTITQSLFSLFHDIQNSGSIVGAVSFNPNDASKKVYKRLIEFFKRTIDINFSPYLIKDSFYSSIPHYTLIEHTNYTECLKQYCKAYKIEEQDYLNEHIYLMEKI